MSAFNLNRVIFTSRITDISSAGSTYVPIPDEFDGDIVEIRTALSGAITNADAAITFEIGGTAMTNSAITITQSGSAAGDIDVSRPTGANTVRAGQALEIITDGGSTGAVNLGVTFVILR